MACDGELLAENYQKKKKRGIQTWQTFAILPNINGQKYTMGETYESGEEEFIFLSPNGDKLEELKKKGYTLCQITCRENEYWITPKGENEIFINRNRIVRISQLNFGDYLTFDETPFFRSINRPKRIRHLVRFRFEKRKLFNLEDESAGGSIPKNTSQLELKYKNTSETQSQCALMNELILGNVLSYLKKKDLKNARLVSHLWSYEGFKILKNRSAFKLSNGDGRDKYGRSRSTTLVRYHIDMKDRPLDNWKIEFLSFNRDLLPKNGNPSMKLIDDLKWFLSKKPNIRALELDGEVNCQLDYDLRMQILTHLQDTIQDLDLGGSWALSNKFPINYSFPESLNFRKIEKFKLSLFINQDEDGEMQDFPWISQLIPAIMNVKALELSNDARDMVLENLTYFPNLNEIIFCNITLAGWELLLKFSPPLKKLCATLIDDEDCEDCDVEEYLCAFEKLLIKQSSSLESLEFHTSFWPHNHELTIRIPALPRLKKLGIHCPYANQVVSIIKLVFGESGNYGPINYKEHFPALQSLIVNPHHDYDMGNKLWREYEVLLENLFPICEGRMETCTTLQYLDIAPFSDTEDPDCDEYASPRAEDLANMFPNVWNAWLKAARETPDRNLSIIMDQFPEPQVLNRMMLRSAF